jgi:hypothetical protein
MFCEKNSDKKSMETEGSSGSGWWAWITTLLVVELKVGNLLKTS